MSAKTEFNAIPYSIICEELTLIVMDDGIYATAVIKEKKTTFFGENINKIVQKVVASFAI